MHAGGRDGNNKTRQQHAWENDGNNKATAQAAAGAARGGGGNMVRVQRKEAADITSGSKAPTTMVLEADRPGGEGLMENPGGGSGPMAFFVLIDLTQLAGLAPVPQGVAGPTDGENRGDGQAPQPTELRGGGRRNPPPTEKKTGGVQTGSGGKYRCPPPQLGETDSGPLGGSLSGPYGDGVEDRRVQGSREGQPTHN